MTHRGRRRGVTAEELKQEVHSWAARIGVSPRRVQVQRMSSKWASCSTSGRICLSADLLGQPRRFREVVIVHELLHLEVANHGKLFKGLITSFLPDWEEVSRGRSTRVCRVARGH